METLPSDRLFTTTEITVAKNYIRGGRYTIEQIAEMLHVSVECLNRNLRIQA